VKALMNNGIKIIKTKIIHITNPEYLQAHVWPLVVKLAESVDTGGMSAHSIMAFLMYSPGIEVCAAIEDKKCIGFCVWQICGPPYYATGMINFIYMDKKGTDALSKFAEKFKEFMQKNTLIYFIIHAQNRKMEKYFMGIMEKQGFKSTKTQYIIHGIRSN